MSTWFHVLVSRIHGLLFDRSLDRDFDQEIEGHLEMLTSENIRRGMARTEAEVAARRKFGHVVRLKESHREHRGLPPVEALAKDVRYGLRMLRKHRGSTLVAVLTLGIGIGLNTAVFTVYDSVALRLLPVSDPGSVVRLKAWHDDGSRTDEFSDSEYRYVRDNAASFSGVAAATTPIKVQAQSQLGQDSEVLQVRLVSENYFSLLGVQAAAGRVFFPGENSVPGTNAVAVLSHRFWVGRFLSDPSILGKTLLVNGVSLTLIGVGPESFGGTGAPATVPDLWIPLAMQSQVAGQQVRRVQVLGRRKAGVSPEQLQSEMAVTAQRLESIDFEGGRIRRLTANPATFFDTTTGDFEDFMLVIEILMLAVAAVLLIGCVNLVNLFLARSATRQREIAVRLALGAGRLRIVRQLCTESALMGILGGAAGLLVSAAICRFLTSLLESKLVTLGTGVDYLFLDLAPSLKVFGFTAGLSLVAGIIVGLAPARIAIQNDVARAMKQEIAVASGGRGWFRDLLIAAQIAACLALLVAAGLFARGVVAAAKTNPGFETERTLMISFPPEALGKSQGERDLRLADVVRTVRQIPRIRSVALAEHPPMMGHSTAPFEPVGSRVTLESRDAMSLFNIVSPDYFETLGIPVVLGRGFSQQEADQDAPVVMISAETAARFWPGEDPLGKRISVVKELNVKRIAGRSFTVIGVVRGVRSTNLSRVDPSYIYFTPGGSSAAASNLLVRADIAGNSVIPIARDAVSGVSPSLGMQMMAMNIESGPVLLQRLMTEAPAIVAAALGMLALLLATVGIYGVVSCLVSQRTRELGVRVALGASGGRVMALILGQALRPVFLGAPVGIAASAVLASVLSKIIGSIEAPDLLFGANPWSPLTLIAVIGFLVVIVLGASWLPALRATRVDPAIALRYE
jgi:predicted permease